MIKPPDARLAARQIQKSWFQFAQDIKENPEERTFPSRVLAEEDAEAVLAETARTVAVNCHE